MASVSRKGSSLEREGTIDDSSERRSTVSRPYHNLRDLNSVDHDVIEGKVDWKGRPATRHKHGGLGPSIVMLVSNVFLNIAVFAVILNLTTYLTAVMHLSVADASTGVTNFMGTGNILAFFVAYVADTYIGRCRTLTFSLSLPLAGLMLQTIQAFMPNLRPPPCSIYDETAHCASVSGGNAALLYISLYLTALGISGIKSTVVAHGADQFDQNDPVEAMQMASFFNWLFLTDCLGGGISLSAVVWLMNNVGWSWGYVTAAFAMFLCVVVFYAGIPRYRITAVKKNNVAKEVIQVYVAAFWNRNYPLPQDPKELYELSKDSESLADEEFLPHQDRLRFLDKAAIKTSSEPSPWKLCRVTQVEDAKTMLAIVPIFCCTILMSTGQAQLVSFSVHQGMTMDSNIGGGIKIPPASLPIIPIIFLVFVVPLYDRLGVPLLRKMTGIPTGLTQLQRIGVGLFLTAVAMAGAGIMEVKRKEVAEQYNMIDAKPIKEPLPISILWLSFQYFIYGICDMFTSVGLTEFFYAEAPKALQSISTSFVCLSVGLGYFFNSALVTIVNKVTMSIERKGWLQGNNLNKIHLERFYWLIALLSFFNFLVYLYIAQRYKYINTSQNSASVRKQGDS